MTKIPAIQYTIVGIGSCNFAMIGQIDAKNYPELKLISKLIAFIAGWHLVSCKMHRILNVAPRKKT